MVLLGKYEFPGNSAVQNLSVIIPRPKKKCKKKKRIPSVASTKTK